MADYQVEMMNKDNMSLSRVYQSIIETCRSIIIGVDMRYHITVWKRKVHTCENDPKSDMKIHI